MSRNCPRLPAPCQPPQPQAPSASCYQYEQLQYCCPALVRVPPVPVAWYCDMPADSLRIFTNRTMSDHVYTSCPAFYRF